MPDQKGQVILGRRAVVLELYNQCSLPDSITEAVGNVELFGSSLNA